MVSGKKTRKSKQTRSSSKVLSIPQLRTAFHHIETFLNAQLKNGKAKTDDVVRTFRKEWRKVFKKDLSAGAARSYIQHMRQKFTMSGGSHQLMSAPVNHTLQPGAYGTYGAFPDYVSKGFSVGIPEPGIQAECGVKNFSPNIPADMGSNQAGGLRRSRRSTRRNRKQRGGLNVLTGAPYAAEMRPFIAQTPPTYQAGIQDAIKGLPAEPSGDPSTPSFQYRMPPVIGKVPGIDVAPLDRNLVKDVSVPY